MNWNFEKIEELIYSFNKEVSLQEPNDRHNMVVQDLYALKTLYKHIKDIQISPLYVTKSYSDFYSNILENNKKDIINSSLFNDIFLTDCKKTIKVNVPFFTSYISTNKLIELLSYSLNPNESVEFKSLMSKSRIQLMNDKSEPSALGSSIHLLSVNKNFIWTNFIHTIKSTYILAHEIGHCSLMNNCPNDKIESSVYYFSSYFKEAYAILTQLLFLDRIRGKNYEITSNMANNMLDYQGFSLECIKDKNYLNAKYAYSYLLAFYLYKIYHEDRTKYNSLIELLKINSFKLNDADLLNSLKINETDLKDAFDYYHQRFEIKKVNHV